MNEILRHVRGGLVPLALATLLGLGLWSCAPTPNAVGRPTAEHPREEIPDGSALSVVFDESVSSESATEGQEIQARLENDLLVDGSAVLHAGAAVHGRVMEARSSAEDPDRPASVLVRLDYVELPFGGKVTVEGSASATAEDVGGEAVIEEGTTVSVRTLTEGERSTLR